MTGALIALGFGLPGGAGPEAVVAGIPLGSVLLPLLGMGRTASRVRRRKAMAPTPASPATASPPAASSLAASPPRRSPSPASSHPVAAADRLLGPVLERAGAGVWTVDRDLRITEIRGGILKHLRREPDEVVGSSLQALVDQHRGDLRLNWVHRVALAGARESIRVQWAGRVWDVWVEPLHEAGRVAGAVAVSVDVTARVDQERELEDRQARISQLQARSTQGQRLEAAGRMAGGLVHDVNNELTAVLGEARHAASRLQDGHGETEGPEDRAELLRTLQALEGAATRASELTRGFLTLNRRDAASGQLVDLNQLVREATGFLDRVVEPDVEIVRELEEELPPVEGDPTQLRQVLVNLVLNARDAMPEGGRMKVRTRHGDGRIVLEVVDEGRGMEPEEARQAFKPYFTTKPPEQGTGLGLSMVQEIVQGMGGGVEVHTSPGQGARFSIRIPASSGGGAPSAGGAVSEGDVQGAPGDLTEDLSGELAGPLHEGERHASRFYAPRTVLLVDDDASVLRSARRLLEAEGHRVVAASSGEEALGMCRRWEEPPDLVLTDLNMPGVDGRTLATELERWWPGIPILFTSGAADPEGSLVNGHRRPHSFVAKPFPPRTFARKVREALLRGDVH